VPEAARNGIVNGYEVRDDRDGDVTVVNGSDVFCVRLLLSSAVNHRLSLTAFTAVGHSPSATVYIHTVDKHRQYTPTTSARFAKKSQWGSFQLKWSKPEARRGESG